MTLTNYWWLLIWLFVGGVLLHYIFPKRVEYVMGKREVRWQPLPAILLTVPYVVWAAYRGDFADTYNYRVMFRKIPDTIFRIPEYLKENTKDMGFSVLSILIKSIFGDSITLYFFLIAAVQIAALIYVYRKYSINYWISFFLFIVSTDYLSWMHNGMRQFLSATIILGGFEFIVRKNYPMMILMILLASTMHGSALIMLPIVFIVQGRAWNKKMLMMLFFTVVVIVYIDRFTPILNELLTDTQYSDMVTNEIWANDDGTNILRVLVYSVPAILSLIGKRFIDEANDPVINICVNCSAVTMAIYFVASVSSGIYVGRLPIYTTLMGYIAVPWIIEHTFTDRAIRLMYIGMVGAFFVFFYYQMHVTWGLL